MIVILYWILAFLGSFLVSYINDYTVEVLGSKNIDYDVNFYTAFWARSGSYYFIYIFEDPFVFGLIIGCLYLEFKKK